MTSGLLYSRVANAKADWWQRPEVRPTQPSIQRNLPTLAPQPTTAPSTPPAQPTATPRVGDASTTPTSSPSTEDPCAPGKSYVGQYCGWSPSVGEGGGGGGGGGGEQVRVGGPEVLGLSKTSSASFATSDIILLIGVLCLALYARSKLEKVKPI